MKKLQTLFEREKIVLKYQKCLKLCQVSESASDFCLSHFSEMFIGNTILIVLESFSELKFPVAVLVRCC